MKTNLLIEKDISWKVIIADDEQDVHHITHLIFEDYVFENKKIEFISAYSEIETKKLIKENPDTAIVLLDVVMEEETSGLKVIEYIRNELKNNLVRIILRTGQPGQAPEERVIRDYDINDYKSKTELTSQKLFTTVTSSLRSYRDLKTIDQNRKGLETIIQFSNSWFDISSEKEFANLALEQLSKLIQYNSMNSIKSSCLASSEPKQDYIVLAATGELKEYANKKISEIQIREVLSNILQSIQLKDLLIKENIYVKHFTTQSNIENIIYFMTAYPLSYLEQYLINIYINNISVSFENIYLFKKLKEALLKSEESNRLKSEFLSIVSHELRTPLTPIIGYSKMLIDSKDFGNNTLPYIDTIYQSGLKLNNIITEIIEMSVIETNSLDIHYTLFKMKDIIDELSIIFQEELSLHQTDFFYISEKEELIFTDASKLKQILYHLISNAVKFTEKGKVTVQLEIKRKSYVISIKDTGIGINQEHFETIFEKFRQIENVLTRKYSGIGLGLSICKKLIEMLKGKIDLKSEVGKGTEFIIDIPRDIKMEQESLES